MTGPTMYDTDAEVYGVKVRVDPIDRPRTDEDDNVMAIFQEEQPVTWEFCRPYIAQALEESDGELDFLDVGCGSGIFSLLMAKHFGARCKAIDKNPRAIQRTLDNAKLNSVELETACETYSRSSAPEGGVKVIGLYPPYHIYPQSIEDKIPQHARGGYDGLGAWREQWAIARRHVAQNGIILFNIFGADTSNRSPCVSCEDGARNTYFSLKYTNILPPMATKTFLDAIYRGMDVDDFVQSFSARHPQLYYQTGVFINDLGETYEEIKHNIDLKGRTWKDRIAVHREIAMHAYGSPGRQKLTDLPVNDACDAAQNRHRR